MEQKRAKPALTSAEFIDAIKMLQQEATYLALRRDSLPEDVYESNADVLKAAL